MNLLIFTDNPKFNMHCEEYKILWEQEGDRIQTSFQKILKLPFTEKEIKLLINDGYNNSNFSGLTERDVMNFRYNNRCKIGTFLHELSHRIVIEYDLFEKSKKLCGFNEVHEVIDLFLYDVIEDLYGTEAGNFRVEYESEFEKDLYKNAWNKTLSLSFEERQNRLERIIKEKLE